jgi:hypothetical protein
MAELTSAVSKCHLKSTEKFIHFTSVAVAYPDNPLIYPFILTRHNRLEAVRFHTFAEYARCVT